MIAVSDAVLILVSTAVLGSGLYRWQNNIDNANLANSRPVATIPASAPNSVTASNAGQSSNTNSQISSANGTSTSTSAQVNASPIDAPVNASPTNIERTVENVVVVSPAPTATIDVSDDNATTASNNAIADVPPYGSYIVQSGDSLSLIAEQYGTTVSTLQEINGINGSLINVGQELRYPLPLN